MSEAVSEPAINQSVSYEQRLRRSQRWVHSLSDLRDQLQGKNRDKVEESMEFIKDNGQVLEPISSQDRESWGLRRYGDVPIEKSLGILALFKSDAQLHPFFKSAQDRLTYWEKPQAVFIPPKQVSGVWRGILIFHESRHAIYHQNGEFAEQENGHWKEEYCVFKDEITIIRELYGEPYDSLINKAVREIERSFSKENVPPGAILNSVQNDLLETVTGKSFSSFERGIRRAAANIDATYRAFDNMGRTDHDKVTQWIYGKELEPDSSQSSES